VMSIVKFLTYSIFYVFPGKQIKHWNKPHSGPHKIQNIVYGQDFFQFPVIYIKLVII
jgi:hypothetical protein